VPDAHLAPGIAAVDTCRLVRSQERA